MKTMLTSVLILTAALGTSCTEKATKSQTADDDVQAKARADALKKEMETAPKVFANRDIFKKNEPAKAPTVPANAEKK
jgi:hypothetical protein